jgi:TonB family protein
MESVQGPKTAIRKGAFGDTVRADPADFSIKPAGAALTAPLEILSKPRPAYTQEARSLGLEGEVLVQVVFEASGTARVERLIKGLGHGLDECALEAAREIRFKPARKDGTPVDSTAIVHIVFQLTY